MSRREVARTEIRLSEGIPWKRRTRQAAGDEVGADRDLRRMAPRPHSRNEQSKLARVTG